jgi:hypothetical protein
MQAGAQADERIFAINVYAADGPGAEVRSDVARVSVAEYH